MTVSRVQANSATANATTPTWPAWSQAPTAGNLLVLMFNATLGTGATGTPIGYTAVQDTPFQYYTSGADTNGIYYKIAAGGDATPSGGLTDTGTPVWDCYTYEFNSTTGWVTSALDQSIHNAASNVQVATKGSGTTGTLAQADELAIALAATSAAVTALSFASSAFPLDNPTSPLATLWLGWIETSAVTALATTASWTTSARANVWVATFEPAAAVIEPVQSNISAKMKARRY